MYRLAVLLFLILGCQNADEYRLEIRELSDDEYPDNPHIGYRATDYNNSIFSQGFITDLGGETIGFRFILSSGEEIRLDSIYIDHLIPTSPAYADGDPYLQRLAIINQEWNRNQVAFRRPHFVSQNDRIVRVDIARNCLNAYLWEVVLYVEESGNEMPYAHAWFDFPHDLYHAEFAKCNDYPFATYATSLEEWHDPPSQPIAIDQIRRVVSRDSATYRDLSDAMYPLAGERAKKRKEIVYPVAFETMRDLQSDSTTFATFSPPGYYDRDDPRQTELGRFGQLDTVVLQRVLIDGNSDTLAEILLRFSDGDRLTDLRIGGIDLDDVPVLPVSTANAGWTSSMGFGNHTFYESYTDHRMQSLRESTYYAYLADRDGRWLDSHQVGIDGPLLHRDPADGSLHLWLLSFERHALVGHYQIYR